MTADHDEKEIKEIEKNWNKVERDLTKFYKVGLRDGISDGRESSFQNSFDNGMYEGFKTGFAIGQYKGVVLATNQLNIGSSLEEDQTLNQPKKGWCQICINNELLESNIQQIKEKQQNISNKNLEQLHVKYSSRCNINLPNKLDSNYFFFTLK